MSGCTASPVAGWAPWPEKSEKDEFQRYLQLARDALLWKLDGLSEYDVRRLDPNADMRSDNPNLPDGDERWWTAYRDRVEAAAVAAASRAR